VGIDEGIQEVCILKVGQ